MAVPLMLVILVTVAIGTLCEARYNAEVASIEVYRTWWFQGMLGLLWLNILCAALSRFPYRSQHTGFVITHIGLLTLLFGAWVTLHFGIDGQLRVIEGQANDVVVLSEPIIQVFQANSPDSTDPRVPLTYRLSRALEARSEDQLPLAELTRQTGLRVERYLPFVMPGKDYSTGSGAASSTPPLAASPGSHGGWTVGFNLRSAFFNVSDSLNSVDRAETRMGPARLRLVVDSALEDHSVARTIPTHSEPDPEPVPAPARAKARRDRSSGPGGSGLLLVKDGKGDSLLGKVSLAELRRRPFTIKGVEVSLVRAYEEGVVAQNKLVEGGHAGRNPALELRVRSGSRTLRDVAFARFPGFTLNEGGTFGVHFVYQPASTGAVGDGVSEGAGGLQDSEASPISQDEVRSTAASRGGTPDRGGDVIEFHAVDPGHLRLELYKDGQSVLTRTVSAGETVQTPWMGMQITIASISRDGGGGDTKVGGIAAAKGPAATPGSDQVTPVELQPKSPLPPSAIFVAPEDEAPSSGGWIVEGDSRDFQTRTGAYEVYYGPDLVHLPFSIQLEKFRKVDYPGTDTAMSFQSTIRVNGSGPPIVISMNEPLKYQGYLIYQASYELGQGGPTASIFSVNRDPGRMIKYIGAMILIAGIAIFTIMRSKPYHDYMRRRAAIA